MENEMASSKSNNLVNPNAREAMNRFSIGGQMVKKMIAAYENGMQ